MSDENMDLCECIWGHELAMRRLLNVIRNSQNVCTDNECFEEGFQSSQNADPSNMLIMTLFFVAALFLYYFRPRSQRINDGAKPSLNGNNGGNGAPPSPPPTMS